jgi:acyl CoA:acetate/3-ketoacid CoA transferase beta subunit
MGISRIGKFLNKLVKGMGGAMDLVASAKHIIVAMQHTDKAGRFKITSNMFTCPITGLKCVKKVVSRFGCF